MAGVLTEEELRHAAAAEFSMDSKAGRLFKATRANLPTLYTQVLSSPDLAGKVKDLFNLLVDEGLRDYDFRGMKDYNKVTFQTFNDAKAKMVESKVPNALINRLQFAFESCVNPLTGSNDSGGSGSDVRRDSGASAKTTTRPCGKRARTSGSNPLFNAFDADLVTLASVLNPSGQMVNDMASDARLEAYCLTEGMDNVKADFGMDVNTPSSAVFERLRHTLRNRFQNRRHWMGNAKPELSDAPRYKTFPDKSEHEKYMAAVSHMSYLQKVVEEQKGDPVLLYVAEGNEEPTILAAVALMDKDSLLGDDTSKTSVFVVVPNNGRKLTVRLPQGTEKIPPLKKYKVCEVPIACLLGSINGKSFSKWAKDHAGVSDDMWKAGIRAFKHAKFDKEQEAEA